MRAKISKTIKIGEGTSKLLEMNTPELIVEREELVIAGIKY